VQGNHKGETTAGRFWRRLGPGLVTGAADDDPSGIGTYSQVGAQFGYSMAWVLPFVFPLLAVIQQISGRIGVVTGQGLAQNLRRHYPRPLLQMVVLLLLLANVINIGADLGAMGAALGLILGGPDHLYTLGFGLICVGLEVYIAYDRYAGLLKFATLSLFAYVAVLFAAGVDWPAALRGTLLPTIVPDSAHAMALIAILGTTISPYLIFWQSGQEVEELHRRHVKPLCIAPRYAGPEFARIRTDTLFGMGVSNLIALSIIFATAATLHAHGITNITTSAQAAQALKPLAGEFAFALFAIGIIGTGLLAVPVLAGSAAYCVSENFGWTEGLDRKPREARAFYATIAVATLGGAALNLAPIDPARALYWAAVVNGLLAAPLLAVMLLIAGNRKVMGGFTISPLLTAVGWFATAVMAVASIAFLVLA
jgi:NRAMP (natural resistance-associated macrophage protein)-like metal ion transporter